MLSVCLQNFKNIFGVEVGENDICDIAYSLALVWAVVW